jgi:hypothetical protein
VILLVEERGPESANKLNTAAGGARMVSLFHRIPR